MVSLAEQWQMLETIKITYCPILYSWGHFLVGWSNSCLVVYYRPIFLISFLKAVFLRSVILFQSDFCFMRKDLRFRLRSFEFRRCGKVDKKNRRSLKICSGLAELSPEQLLTPANHYHLDEDFWGTEKGSIPLSVYCREEGWPESERRRRK